LEKELVEKKSIIQANEKTIAGFTKLSEDFDVQRKRQADRERETNESHSS